MVFLKMALAAVCLLAFTPPASARDVVVRATWYGPQHQGLPMKNGQPFDMWDPTTVASRYLPIGTRILLTNLKNGRSREAVVRDRSPISPIDCSYALGAALGFAHLEILSGDTKVRITIIN